MLPRVLFLLPLFWTPAILPVPAAAATLFGTACTTQSAAGPDTYGNSLVCKAGVWTANIYADTNGNVGISTTTPGALLAIQQSGTTNSSGLLILDPTDNYSARLYIDASGVQRLDNGSAAGNSIALNGAGSGYVGIGTAAPGTRLEVNGQVTVDSWATAAATAVCRNGNVLSACASSIRYKENVQDLGMGLGELMRMRPVTFKWKGRDENDHCCPKQTQI